MTSGFFHHIIHSSRTLTENQRRMWMKVAHQLLKLCLKMSEGKQEKRRRPVQSQPGIHLMLFFSLQCSSSYIRPFLCNRPSIKLAVLTKTREDMFQYIMASFNRFSFFLFHFVLGGGAVFTFCSFSIWSTRFYPCSVLH